MKVKQGLAVLVTAAMALVAISAEPTADANGKRTFMGVNRNLSEKIVRNAKIALEASCQGKSGESVLVLGRERVWH